jgi:phage terminase large subunit-like protein
VAYDPYQLHDVMTRLSKKYRRVDFYSFPQGQERLEGDTKLMKHIIQEELHHSGNEIMREHVQNADGKLSGSDKAIRIVKRDASRKIDSMIALSMAVKKGFELLEAPTKSRAYKVRVIER